MWQSGMEAGRDESLVDGGGGNGTETHDRTWLGTEVPEVGENGWALTL
jgi:hypothetical protein